MKILTDIRRLFEPAEALDVGILNEYNEAKEEPDFDGMKDERLKELQVRILEYLFSNASAECDSKRHRSGFLSNVLLRED